jgi:hypothetical protein
VTPKPIHAAPASAAPLVPTIQSAAMQQAEVIHKVTRVCDVHGNKNVWYEANSDVPHCGICQPNRYAPPADSPALRPSRSNSLAPIPAIAASTSAVSNMTADAANPDMTADGMPGLF